jgi:Ca2+-binding RTX toxin-like protein
MTRLVRRGGRGTSMVAVALLLLTAVSGSLAANVVATSRAGGLVMATGAQELKPLPECAALTLQDIAAGSGSFNTSNSAELVVGSAGVDNIGARNGDDCIVAGSGNDTLNGGVGHDVCIGGLGTDTFNACETTIQ